MLTRAEEINRFWFIKCCEEDWFKKDLKFDEEITSSFLTDYGKACEGTYDHWREHSKNCLALIVLLDQFSRNMFRDVKKAFSQDTKAQTLSKYTIKNNYFADFTRNEIFFSLMPLLHSEDIRDHEIAHKNCDKFLSRDERYEQIKKSWNDHTKAIKKFGRYPHRNKILGRISTDDEMLLLTQPDSSL